MLMGFSGTPSEASLETVSGLLKVLADPAKAQAMIEEIQTKHAEAKDFHAKATDLAAQAVKDRDQAEAFEKDAHERWNAALQLKVATDDHASSVSKMEADIAAREAQIADKHKVADAHVADAVAQAEKIVSDARAQAEQICTDASAQLSESTAKNQAADDALARARALQIDFEARLAQLRQIIS